MKIHKFYFSFLLLFVQSVSAQNSGAIALQGRIVVDSSAIEAINILNINTNKVTATDGNGDFNLVVNEGDVLVFSAVNLVTLQRKILKEDINAGGIRIQMTVKSITLREVIINENAQISAESIGIVPFDQKRYTPAERKLYTAQTGLLDRPLNWISGRTAELKKGIVVERNLIALSRLEYLFEDKYYTETLKINRDYIKGFQYYCIENNEFVTALESKNKTLCMFLIITLAQNYNKITTYEN